MPKKIKRVVSLIVAIAMGLSLTGFTVFAEGSVSASTDIKERITESLYFVEMNKEKYNMSDIDFEELKIGSPVHCYEYVSAGFNELRIMYPLLFKDSIVAFAIPNENAFQINTLLAEKVAVEEVNSFAIIYDDDGCYVYTDEDRFILLAPAEDKIRSRLSIETTAVTAFQHTNELSVTNVLCGATSVGYVTPNALTRQSGSYVGCDVEYVPQNPPNNSEICWAATVACIANCVNGTSLTAVDVAQAYYGTTNYNQGLYYQTAVALLYSRYNIPYTALEYVPNDTVISRNLNYGCPLYISCTDGGGGYHAVCLYGIDPLRGYAYLMNPSYGFDTASYTSSGYTYVSPYSGATWTLSRSGVHVTS